MTKQSWDNESLRKFFRIFNVRAKEVSAELGLEHHALERMLYGNSPVAPYKEIFEAYFEAKRKARILVHESLIEYYNKLKLDDL